MWKEVEGGTTKPDPIDMESSKVYVYVRKDFESFERIDEVTGETQTCWKWLEQSVKKEDWEIYRDIIKSENDITDLQEALVELYEIVIGTE